MIHLADIDTQLVEALPELAGDRTEYERRRKEDPEFSQSFFSYSFVPTLQAALDRDVRSFSDRAFALLEELVTRGDEGVGELLREEFFEYGPACEKWMRRALPQMGLRTRALAQR